MVIWLIFSGILVATGAAALGLLSGASFWVVLAFYAGAGVLWALGLTATVLVRAAWASHSTARFVAAAQAR